MGMVVRARCRFRFGALRIFTGRAPSRSDILLAYPALFAGDTMADRRKRIGTRWAKIHLRDGPRVHHGSAKSVLYVHVHPAGVARRRVAMAPARMARSTSTFAYLPLERRRIPPRD